MAQQIYIKELYKEILVVNAVLNIMTMDKIQNVSNATLVATNASVKILFTNFRDLYDIITKYYNT